MQNQVSRTKTLTETSNVEAYVDLMATLLLLDIPPELRSPLVENFERVIAIAAPLLEFELPDTLEPAPTFHP